MPSADEEVISAADLEKYAYCPLSWWLSRTMPEDDDDTLKKGERLHEALSAEIVTIPHKEQRAREAESTVFWFAIGASIIGVSGISFVLALGLDASWILTVLALIWLLASTYFLYKTSTVATPEERFVVERLVAVFAVVAMLIALNAVMILRVDRLLAQVLEISALLWLIGASAFLHRALTHAAAAERLRAAHRVVGNVSYVDAEPSELLVSKRYGLSGRPDYVVEIDGTPVPVEVKTGRVPRGPLFSHIVQLAAYCMILEDLRGVCHSGIIKYGTAEHEIEMDDGLKKLVLSKAEEMRRAWKKGDVHRNHNRPGKCAACSRRSVCPERLV
ncbi:MAG: CRISPR-associated protein Cas4 [Candidatus Thermoplasmatota archaeon]